MFDESAMMKRIVYRAHRRGCWPGPGGLTGVLPASAPDADLTSGAVSESDCMCY